MHHGLPDVHLDRPLRCEAARVIKQDSGCPQVDLDGRKSIAVAVERGCERVGRALDVVSNGRFADDAAGIRAASRRRRHDVAVWELQFSELGGGRQFHGAPSSEASGTNSSNLRPSIKRDNRH